MKKFIGSLGLFAATMILAVSAVAQQEVAPDHFDASPASAQAQRKVSQTKKSVRPAQTAKAKATKKELANRNALVMTASAR